MQRKLADIVLLHVTHAELTHGNDEADSFVTFRDIAMKPVYETKQDMILGLKGQYLQNV